MAAKVMIVARSGVLQKLVVADSVVGANKVVAGYCSPSGCGNQDMVVHRAMEVLQDTVLQGTSAVLLAKVVAQAIEITLDKVMIRIMVRVMDKDMVTAMDT